MQYPTSADKGLLSRGMKPAISEVLGRMASALERIVNFGTHVVLWTGPKSAGKDPSLAPPLMLLYHAVEAADAISVLLRRGCVDPCGPILRSQLEATISAFYILDNDTERRGLAYRYGQLHDRSVFLERLDPTSNRGKEVIRRFKADKTFGGLVPSINAARLAAQRKQVQAWMIDPRYARFALNGISWRKRGLARRRGMHSSAVQLMSPHWLNE